MLYVILHQPSLHIQNPPPSCQELSRDRYLTSSCQGTGTWHQDGIRDFASGRYYEACCSKCDACKEHCDCRIYLYIGTCFFCHIREELFSMAKVNGIFKRQKDKKIFFFLFLSIILLFFMYFCSSKQLILMLYEEISFFINDYYLNTCWVYEWNETYVW